MIATAIGPQKLEPDSGIIARIAAAAVNRIGRMRRTVASITAVHGGCPASMSCSIWSTRMIELRMIIPNSAMKPSIATKPNGTLPTKRNNVTPMMASGAVSSTSRVLLMLCRWSMSSVITVISMIGTTALTEPWPRALSSIAPPMSMW